MTDLTPPGGGAPPFLFFSSFPKHKLDNPTVLKKKKNYDTCHKRKEKNPKKLHQDGTLF